jgi:hypothetical protein
MLTAAAKTIVEEASRSKMWIYEPAYRRWYTPEEFHHIFSYADASEEFVKTLQLRHPSEGVQAGFQKLLDLHGKLAIFTKKVIDYYK